METGSCLEVNNVKAKYVIKLFLQVLPTASVSPSKRSAEASCFSMLNASQTSHHATRQRYNVPKPTLAVLLLEEKEAENHIRNTAYLNTIIPVLGKTVPKLPSVGDILSTFLIGNKGWQNRVMRFFTALSADSLT